MRTKSRLSRTRQAILGVIDRSHLRRRRSPSLAATERRESGQVLVLVALASSVLIGFLALSVDVGNLYLARRQAQSAADAAAIVGAQNKQGVIPDVTLVAPAAVQDARR